MGELHSAAAEHDEISQQREEALIEAMLRYQVKLDPDHLGPVLDVAAVGIVNNAWRNSPVEDWHAGDGPLSDGDMLRVNAHTTWRVRDIMRRWRTEVGLTAQSSISVLDELEANDAGWLAVRIFRWLVKPSRQLPIGGVLADLAGDDLREFTEHVDGTLGGFVATAERRGTRFAFYRAAAHGGLAYPHWWGTPTWPELVRTFAHVLDDPHHPHWGPGGSWRRRLSPEPDQVTDRTGLQRILLNRPWNLEPRAAQWIVSAGIGPPASAATRPPRRPGPPSVANTWPASLRPNLASLGRGNHVRQAWCAASTTMRSSRSSIRSGLRTEDRLIELGSARTTLASRTARRWRRSVTCATASAPTWGHG